MIAKNLIQFTNENPVCYLATSEENQPRVRCLHFWFADETGFYFQTGSIKDMVKQLRKNPKAEVCFHKHGENAGETLRLAGSVEFVDDIELKKKAINDRPFLKLMGLDYDSPGLIIFKFSKGQATFWNMSNNLKAKELIEFDAKN